MRVRKLIKYFIIGHRWLSRVSAIAAAICIFAMVCTIVPDSIGRSFFNKPLHGTLEFNMILMSAIVFLGLSWTQVLKAHVRIEILLSKMGPRWHGILVIFSWVATLVFFLVITVGGTQEAIRSFQVGENLWGVAKFPLWPGRAILSFGCALLCIQLVIDIVREIKTLLFPDVVVDSALPTKEEV